MVRKCRYLVPIWAGVGGTPAIFVRAVMLGLPLMVDIIGGEPKRFRPLIDLYRQAGHRAGHSPERLTVGLHSIGFLADTTDEAAEIFYPGYAHTFTEIGKERSWSAATRAQFDALPARCWSATLKRSRKRSFTEGSSRRHLPHHIPNGYLDASAPNKVERHRDPRHRRGTYRPERARRHPCTRLM
jgi:alkanesulfonate monooxygenase SsuD/methylene tetrahydromethanopterin reductase-like flavin-dependent oxidoreductase (luciferase family)